VVLGVGEIIPPLLLGNARAWWIATGAFALLGAIAFINTVTRLEPGMFPESAEAYRDIRTLLLALAGASVATAVVSGTIAYLVGHVPSERAVSTSGALLILLTAVVFVIGWSERVLNNVY